MQIKRDEHPASSFLKSLCSSCNGGFIHFLLIDRAKNAINKFITIENIDSIPTTLRNYRGYNVYFGVAIRLNGDMTKDGIIEIPVLWVEIDLTDKNGVDLPNKKEILQRLKDFPLKPTFVINSGGGLHVYWKLKNPFLKSDISLAETLLKRLAFYFGGDRSSTDASHNLRLPGTWNFKPKYKTPRKVTIEEANPENEYSPDDFEAILPQAEEPYHLEERQYHQETNERLNQIMECEFLKHCDENRATLLEPEWYAMDSILARETGGRDLIHSLSRGYPGYSPQETDKKILHAINDTGPATCERIKRELFNCGKDCGVKSPASLAIKSSDPLVKKDESKNHSSLSSHKERLSWPSPLAQEAFYGLPGEFVNLIEPHTEADPAAILIQILTGIGNVIGATAFFQVEADKHYLKIFPVLVGETSKGRKGTSWGYIKTILKQIDPECRIMSGLSSGEGLIWQVRDEIKKNEPIREKGRIKGYQEVVVDPGEDDKRLFIIEQEFASTLRVIGRDGNILSPVIRQAWDDGNLQALAKNSPAKATGAHISIIGHVTKDELRRYLDRTETGNGFANRFIWLCIRRSKTLPDGGQFYKQDFEPILKRLREAVEFGKTVGEMGKDSGAKKIWDGVYPDLSEGKPGLFGAVTSRAEAQVMRIACIYALLDESKMIREEHLLAALALWDYSEASARYIFGDATGDSVADRILQAIRGSTTGLTRTEIRDLFFRNVSGERMDTALSFLESHNLIRMAKQDTGGRPVERWVAL